MGAALVAVKGLISVGGAARKYGVPQTTVSDWIASGLVRRPYCGGRGRPSYVVEADVAALVALWVPGRGRGLRARRVARLVAVGDGVAATN